jgi:hypothetical protein
VTDIFEGPQFRYLDLRTLFGAVFVGLLQEREDVAAASRSLSLSAIAAVASAVRVAVRQNIFSFCVTRIRDRKKKVCFICDRQLLVCFTSLFRKRGSAL